MKRIAICMPGQIKPVLLLVFAALIITACQGAAPESETEASPAATSTIDPENLTDEQLVAGQVAFEGIESTDGETLFVTYCAKCHGLQGLGDGPSVGSLNTQSGMNLTVLQDRSDEELLETVSAGKGIEMPAWELLLTLEQRQALVAYVRTLGSG